MIYVVDASVAFKWNVPEKDDAKARQLRQDYLSGIHDMLAPDFFPAEIAHALTRAERSQRISIGQAIAFFTDIMTTSPQLLAWLPLTQRTIDISSFLRIGVYDCLYVALAEKENCELVTGDEKLVKSVQKHFPFVRTLSGLVRCKEAPVGGENR